MVMADPSLFPIESRVSYISKKDSASTAAPPRRRVTQGSASDRQDPETIPPRPSSPPWHGEQPTSRAPAEGKKPPRQKGSVDSRRRSFQRSSSNVQPSTANEGASTAFGAAIGGSEGEILSAGSRHRRRPRARSLGTTSGWPTEQRSVTDSGNGDGIDDVSSGGHPGSESCAEVGGHSISGGKMKTVRSVFFTRPNLFEEARLRMRRCRGRDWKPGTARRYLNSAGLLACMAALASTSLVASPFLASRPTRAAIAVSYVCTFIWWDPGAGSLWLSLLAVALGLANRAGGNRAEDDSERWLSFGVSLSALAGLCLYCEKRSLSEEIEDDGRADASSSSSVHSQEASSQLPSGARAIPIFAWRLLSALTVSPLFVALEILVECGYRPCLMPDLTHDSSEMADNANVGAAEKGDGSSRPLGASAKRSVSAGPSSFPTALKDTE